MANDFDNKPNFDFDQYKVEYVTPNALINTPIVHLRGEMINTRFGQSWTADCMVFKDGGWQEVSLISSSRSIVRAMVAFYDQFGEGKRFAFIPRQGERQTYHFEFISLKEMGIAPPPMPDNPF